MKIALSVFCILFMLTNVFAAGETGLAVLKVGVGARAVWTLVAYGGTMTTAAYLLIDHLWVD